MAGPWRRCGQSLLTNSVGFDALTTPNVFLNATIFHLHHLYTSNGDGGRHLAHQGPSGLQEAISRCLRLPEMSPAAVQDVTGISIDPRNTIPESLPISWPRPVQTPKLVDRNSSRRTESKYPRIVQVPPHQIKFLAEDQFEVSGILATGICSECIRNCRVWWPDATHRIRPQYNRMASSHWIIPAARSASLGGGVCEI